MTETTGTGIAVPSINEADKFEYVTPVGVFSFEDIERAAVAEFGGVETIGTEEADKETLIGKPMMILEWDFHESKDYDGAYFVWVKAALPGAVPGDDARIVGFSDGSTGIMSQLAEITRRRQAYRNLHPEKDAQYPLTGILKVRAGLRKSEYYYNETTGETSDTGGKGYAKASTYYLSE